MRHTKIVATVGPASQTPEILAELVQAGVDVFRLNFSHGTHDSHADAYRTIRRVAGAAGRPVAIMQDLSGPKIRTGTIEGGGPLMLGEGQELRIGVGDAPGRPGRVSTTYAGLVASARPGDRLLLDDGRIELRVVANAPDELHTIVVNGGPLSERKGINAPGVVLSDSALTEKDVEDLRFGLDLGVDLVALSFVQSAEDVRRAREVMVRSGRQVPVIAKIERPAALSNMPGILAAAQGVMVARGDLGLEMPLEQVPRAQKEIIRLTRAQGLPVIVATQVLESMRTEPRPTRAEVSDAANAVHEGADAIMLAGETAAGAYPVRAVRTLDAIVRDAEVASPPDHVPLSVDPTGSRHGHALCEAAVTLATAGHATAIVAVTREGRTARLLAAVRPPTAIFAATPDRDVASALALIWGTTPIVTTERDVERLEALLLERRLMDRGAVVVFVNVSPELDRPDVNFLNLQKVG
jgi:pyruvate kinase